MGVRWNQGKRGKGETAKGVEKRNLGIFSGSQAKLGNPIGRKALLCKIFQPVNYHPTIKSLITQAKLGLHRRSQAQLGNENKIGLNLLPLSPFTPFPHI
jgi:hypothetical protein